MKRKTLKRTISVLLAIMMIAISTTSVFASEDTTDMGTGSVAGYVEVTGTFLPTTIFVTHPVTAEYCVIADDGGFISTDIPITNLTKVPINVSILEFKAAPGGAFQFYDVFPEDIDWDTLGLEQSKSFIALGIKIKDQNEWVSGNSSVYYAANNNQEHMGILSQNTTGTFELLAYHGLAFDEQYESRHQIEFLFNLV